MTPTGTVTYTFFTDTTCTDPGVSAGMVTLNDDGTVPNSNIQGPLAVGGYAFRAVYSGDANYSVRRPAVSRSSWPGQRGGCHHGVRCGHQHGAAGTETVGASAYDTARVTGAVGVTPTGTVTYTFFTNDTCFGTGPLGGHRHLDGGGVGAHLVDQGSVGGGFVQFPGRVFR